MNRCGTIFLPYKPDVPGLYGEGACVTVTVAMDHPSGGFDVPCCACACHAEIIARPEESVKVDLKNSERKVPKAYQKRRQICYTIHHTNKVMQGKQRHVRYRYARKPNI
jgi:hypothetical protein